MIILQIEHAVANFDAWKKVFDSNADTRKKGGVKRYTIFMPADKSNYVIIQLEFDDISNAKNFQEFLKKLWTNVDGKLISGPQSKIIEVVESKELI